MLTTAAAMGQDVKRWEQEFRTLIQEVKPGHRWTLTLDRGLLPNNLKPGWTQYQQYSFARFQCSLCFWSWASAHVLVLFHMHWNEIGFQGEVKMRVFGQRCRKCTQPPFEVPQFMQENISRVLNNLVLHILKKSYREGFKLVEVPVIQEIALEGPHDSRNCEACLQGFCTKRSDLVITLPVSLLPPSASSQIESHTPQKPFPKGSSTIKNKVKKGKGLPRSSLYKYTEAEGSPSYWRQSADTSYLSAPSSNVFSSYHTTQNSTVRRSSLCCFGIIVIIIIVIIIIIYK